MVARQVIVIRIFRILRLGVFSVVLATSCTNGDAVAGPVASMQMVSTTTPAGPAALAAGVEVDPDGPPVTNRMGELLGPVTTRKVSGGDTSIYSGVLGRLDPAEQVAPPVGQPPVNTDGIMPLTGLPGEVPDRPAVVVKVDNVGPARPQTGLDNADIVYEEEVEAGFTRLAAVFHSRSSYVGPVRSGRTTDLGVLSLFASPVFIYSGANVATDSLIRSQSNVQNHSFDTTSGFWRNPDKPNPSDLYTHTSPHWQTASGSAPLQQFHYRSPGQGIDGVDTSSFRVSYLQNTVDWQWDGAAWQRHQGGSPHVNVDGEQLQAANVIVVETERVSTGMVDSAGQGVPEFVFVGSGKAVVFTGGKRIEGTWTRPSLSSVPTFTTADGEAIEHGVGQTWVEIVSSTDQIQ